MLKNKSLIALFLASLMLFVSCASATMITTTPSGAKVFINGEFKGKTPYSHSDTKIVTTCTNVRFEKKGYEKLFTNICRNEQADALAILGGVFLLFPFLWTMKYNESHTYELVPVVIEDSKLQGKVENKQSNSKFDKLRELKDLYDEGILTKEEYEIEKMKILEEK